MAYINPETVLAPRNRIKSTEVLYNGGEGEWSVARLEFDDHECLGMRWNGADGQPGIGNPQSHGQPTWFVIPDTLADIIREQVEGFGDSKHAELLSAYREMAADVKREEEAHEWCEGLAGDAIHQAG